MSELVPVAEFQLPVANPGALSERELLDVLRSSLYPGAGNDSLGLVISYCAAAKLDVMQKPVHIVPMWNSAAGKMVDTIMPGIALYRITAARSGVLAGITEPEYGPDVTEAIGGVSVTFPQWCRVTVKRRLLTGELAEFTSREFWKENYATKGGKEKSPAPNAMWAKRPYAQIAKCAESQALRRAFPEMCSAPTAEEMEGKSMMAERNVTPQRQTQPAEFPKLINEATAPLPWQDFYPSAWFHVMREGSENQAWGDIAEGPDGETAMLDIWRDDKTNPYCCAWAANWIKDTLMPAIPDMQWIELQDQYPGTPEIEGCTPSQLRKAVGILLQLRQKHEARQQAEQEGGEQ